MFLDIEAQTVSPVTQSDPPYTEYKQLVSVPWPTEQIVHLMLAPLIYLPHTNVFLWAVQSIHVIVRTMTAYPIYLKSPGNLMLHYFLELTSLFKLFWGFSHLRVTGNCARFPPQQSVETYILGPEPCLKTPASAFSAYTFIRASDQV